MCLLRKFVIHSQRKAVELTRLAMQTRGNLYLEFRILPLYENFIYCFIISYIHPHCNSLRTFSLGAMQNTSVIVWLATIGLEMIITTAKLCWFFQVVSDWFIASSYIAYKLGTRYNLVAVGWVTTLTALFYVFWQTSRIKSIILLFSLYPDYYVYFSITQSFTVVSKVGRIWLSIFSQFAFSWTAKASEIECSDGSKWAHANKNLSGYRAVRLYSWALTILKLWELISSFFIHWSESLD